MYNRNRDRTPLIQNLSEEFLPEDKLSGIRKSYSRFQKKETTKILPSYDTSMNHINYHQGKNTLRMYVYLDSNQQFSNWF